MIPSYKSAECSHNFDRLLHVSKTRFISPRLDGKDRQVESERWRPVLIFIAHATAVGGKDRQVEDSRRSVRRIITPRLNIFSKIISLMRSRRREKIIRGGCGGPPAKNLEALPPKMGVGAPNVVL